MKIFTLPFYLLLSFIALTTLGLSTVHAVPANDDFANATIITGATGRIEGDNSTATPETPNRNYVTSGESECRSIWYEWTPPANGNYTFNTFGSIVDGVAGLDTILAVFTGTNLDSFVDNDDFSPPLRFVSSLSFDAVTTETYYIAVDVWHVACVTDPESDVSTKGGQTWLNWGLTSSVPSNDDFILPLPAAAQLSGASGSASTDPATTTTVNATPEVGEPNHITIPNTIIANSSIWFQWTPPYSGDFSFNTSGSDYDTTLAVYDDSNGTLLSNLVNSKVAENDDTNGEIQSKVYISANSARIYFIAVDGYLGQQGDVVLNWSEVTPTGLNNDMIANAAQLTGVQGIINGDTFFATIETNEPFHNEKIAGPYASIWFKWTAPSTGKYNFNTNGSDFDTTMSVYMDYDGSNFASLTRVTADDDSGTDTQSSVSFYAIKGIEYYFAIDGFEGDRGNVTLSWMKKSPWILYNPAITSGSLQP